MNAHAYTVTKKHSNMNVLCAELSCFFSLLFVYCSVPAPVYVFESISQSPYTQQQSIEKTVKSCRVFTFFPAFIRGRISLVAGTHRQTRDAVVLPCLQSPW